MYSQKLNAAGGGALLTIVATATLVFCMAFVGWAPVAHADFVPPGGTLFYEGNINSTDGKALNNEYNTSGSEANLVYQEFVIPVGQSWTITAVWSNDNMDSAFGSGITSAYWAIRTGMSAGTPGSVVAGGSTDSASAAVSGNAIPGSLTGSEYTVTVSNLNVTLGAGEYWLTVAPVGATLNDSGNSDTNALTGAGTNGGQGGPSDGGEQAILPTQYVGTLTSPSTSPSSTVWYNGGTDNSALGNSANYFDGLGKIITGTITSGLATDPQGFSVGVLGTSGPAATPEPSAIAIWTLGLAGLGFYRARRRVAPAA